MKKHVTLILICLFAFCRGFAQQSEAKFGYNFIHYGIEEGLPSNETYYFLEDSRGYLWIGTDKGVARFNGYAFKTFTTNDGLTDNTILRMASGPDGKVWMACFNNTLSYYDQGKFHPFRHNEKLLYAARELMGPPEIDIDQDYRIFYKSTRGALIIDTTGNINLLKKGRIPGDGPETHWIFNFNNKVKSFSSVNVKRIGIVQVDIQVKDSTYIHTFLASGGLNSYFLQAGTRRYFYLQKTIIIVEGEKIIFEKTLPNEALGVMAAIGDEIWISSMNGVIVMDKNGKFKNRFLKNKQISSIFKDKNNNIWISTLNDGIYQIKNRALQLLQPNETPVAHAFPVLFNLDDVVFGIRKNNEAGCPTSRDATEEVQLFNQFCAFESHYPLDVFFTSENYQFNFDQYFIKLDNINSAKSITKNGQNIYAASKSQIYKLNYKKNKYYWERLYYLWQNKSLSAIHAFDDGTILLGAIDGLYLFNGKEATAHPRNKAINSRIQDIELLENDTILATRGNGLKVLKKDKILTYTDVNGLLSNSVSSLFKLNNQLWVATDGGVNLLYTQNDTIVLEKKITVDDGLSSKQIHQLIVVDSMIFLGLERGLAKVDLKLLDQHKTDHIPLYFTNIRINDADVVPLKKHNLKHDQKLVRIDFEAIDFKQSGNILYKYRMNNLSDRWDYTNNRSVLYSNLSPGKYTFEIAAQYANGAWTDVSQIEFMISKPYWETWWFRVGFFLLLSGSGYWIYSSSSIARKKREQLAKELNTSKQMALGSQINPHFIFNSLNSIYNFLLKNKDEAAQVYLVRFSRLIRNVFENSMESFISLAHEIETLNIYLELEQLRFSNKFEYRFQLDEDLQQENTFIPPMLLQPLAENAIWHGLLNKEDMEPALLQISVKKSGETLQFSVLDNGVGLSHSKEKQKNQLLRKTKSTGLSITQKRVSLVNEYYNKEYYFTVEDFVEDHQIKGTIVAFSLPYISSKP